MKKIIVTLLIVLINITNAQSITPEEVPNNEKTQQFFGMIVEYVRLKDVHNELEQLRRHAETASSLLWLEKSETNIQVCREIIKRYFIALEKLPEHDEAKQNLKKSAHEFFANTTKKQQEDSATVYTAA
jgi:hypothetical protein